MITSRLSGKARTTIPLAVRRALGLRGGDEIAYNIEGGRVVMTKASSEQAHDPFRCFMEWNSEADQQAYANL